MRRKRRPQDSLELFLDALSNMFGAFLFLLLFIVVLLQTTRRELSEQRRQHPSYNELASLTAERDALTTEWNDSLEQSRRLASLQNKILSPELAATIQKTIQTIQNQQETENKNAILQAEIDARNAAVNATLQNRDRLQAEIETKRLQFKELENQIQAEKTKQTRQTSPPQLRFSDKIEFQVVVKYGRLYCLKRLKGDGAYPEHEFNDEDFYVVARDEHGAIVSPNPRRGIDLSADLNEIEEALSTRFADVKASRYKIAFMVCADSFAEFNVARNYFKNNGYDVRILIGKTGQRILDRGGRSKEAQ